MNTDAKFRKLFNESPVIRNTDVRLVYDVNHKIAGRMLKKWAAEGLVVRDHTTKQAAYYRENV